MAASFRSSSVFCWQASFLVISALLSSQIWLIEGQNSAGTSGILPSLDSRNSSVQSSTTCSSTLYRCRNGRCIPTSWLCDGDNDCESGEDEVNCAQKKCGNGEHKCTSSSKCIPSRWLCDAEDDCGDNSDEHEVLCANRTCGDGRFKCPNSTLCIPNTWLCDTQKDCENGEDELNCTLSSECSPEEFKCKSGRCIFKRWKCDHDNDCPDGSDEEDCQYTCGPAQTQCESDHKCIPERWKCDGERDCADGSDEKNCYGISNHYSNVTCRSYEFRCDDGVCIHKAWECDGEPDCPDGSDEMHCVNKTCGPEQFACSQPHVQSVQCIPRAYRCNGKKDCYNGKDEEGCATTVAPKKCDPIKEFDCGSGTCIPTSLVCNGKYDCPQNLTTKLYADEAPVQNCGKRKDFCKENPCDSPAVCINTIVGRVCDCPFGYKSSKVSSNGRVVCEDINECEDRPRRCTQKCHNTPGSFSCGCHQGYMLSRDKVTCRALGLHPKLWFSHRSSIIEVDLATRKAKTIIDGLESAVAIDFVEKTNTIVWTDVAEEMIYSMDLTKAARQKDGVISAKNQSKILVKDGLSTPDGVAVDWVHGLVFWTDTGLNTISVVDLDGKFRKTLIADNLDEPRAIAVDPTEGLIFWTDWGKEAKIERASMDGTDRMTIINQDIQWPNGLAIDLVDKRIFWADAKLKTIKSANYMGQEVEVVLTSASDVRHPFSLTVFEEKIYWTDWDTEGIHEAHKYTGDLSKKAPLIKGLVGPMAIRVVHEMSQPEAHNKCFNSPCDQLCLPKWSDSTKVGMKQNKPYVCQCADGFVLDTDGTRCISNGTDHKSVPVATTEASGAEPKQAVPTTRHGRAAFVAVAFIACIALAVAFIAYAIWRHSNRNTRRPKRFTLENPVYRRTVVDGSNGVDHYDHLRLSMDPVDGLHFHSGNMSNGGSGVYQPTTTTDEMVEPDAMGVGVVQNGKYSMKLPLTEHEEGQDYA